MLKKWPPLFLSGLLICGLLPGCIISNRHAYYVSPLNGNSEDYHPLPMRQDTARKAVYIGGGFFTGRANDRGNDQVTGGRASVYVAQHQGILQWYYGMNATLGSYRVNTWDSATDYALPSDNYNLPPPNAQQLAAYSGPHTFGAAGFSGGINGVIPMGQGEWRFLGMETSLNREFGDYLHFRSKLPDSLASYIVRQSFFGTFGFSSELVFRTRQGNFGFRFSGGWATGAPYNRPDPDNKYGPNTLYYSYGTFAFQYTYHRWTIWYHDEFATRASSIKLGLTYRLGGPRLPKKEYRPPPPHPPLPPFDLHSILHHGSD
jgi:hypothetical protein